MLPHESLERYFAEVEAAVAQLPAYAESYVEEILTAERANLRIRLRYDNTPHFLDLPSFPHHKYLRDAVVATSKPDLLEVLKEANQSV